MKKVLIRDLVIPAGTVFDTAPTSTTRADDCFVEAVIGLTKNTYGTVTYCVNDDDFPKDMKKLKKWFRDVK